jgi:hypothetical protein
LIRATLNAIGSWQPPTLAQVEPLTVANPERIGAGFGQFTICPASILPNGIYASTSSVESTSALL